MPPLNPSNISLCRVTPSRYTQLQALNFVTVESLANASPSELEILEGFDSKVAQKLVLQAQSRIENIYFFYPGNYNFQHPLVMPMAHSVVELYFDIEAEPDLNLDYMLGVLVVKLQTNTETFYSLLAERPEDEELIWQQFLDLVWQYPTAIFSFLSLRSRYCQTISEALPHSTRASSTATERFCGCV